MVFNLQTKLLSIIGAGIIGIGVVSAISFLSLSDNVNKFEEVLASDVQAALAADRMSIEFKIQVQEWKNVLLRGHEDERREKYWKQFNQQHDKVQKLGAEISSLTSQPEIKKLTNQFLQEHSGLIAKYRKGLDVFIATNFDHKAGDKAVSGIDRAPTKLSTEIADLAFEKATLESELTSASADNTIAFGYTAIAVGVLVILALSVFFIKQWLINPITKAHSYLLNLASGHLDFTMERYDSADEVGQMYGALKQLQGNLQEGTNAINSSIQQLMENAQELQHIATTIDQGTEEQYKRTDQVATAITEMSSAAGEVARYAQEAAASAQDVDKTAQSGVTIMREAIATINSTSEQIASTAEVVKRLESDTQSVGTVLDVIKGIAEQTNLLALNAAIEAARAGEQGRGFAVVADEVRTLAQRTQESTAEIHTIIENVQNGAINAVSAIETGQTRTQDSVSQVNQAGETITNISSAVQTILGTNEQIAQAAQEQSSVSDDISQNVNEITSIAAESSDNAKQTLQLSETLTKMSGVLRDQLKKLKAS
ncbi:methyl-accepting chemotaxis protein [Bermanella sp. R86510]|uniref:methyl-accepting chemotaxis protein n=1 Tax=unclassified Bermanella TaxID=2627862 RepID=UPI0037C8A99D